MLEGELAGEFPGWRPKQGRSFCAPAVGVQPALTCVPVPAPWLLRVLTPDAVYSLLNFTESKARLRTTACLISLCLVFLTCEDRSRRFLKRLVPVCPPGTHSPTCWCHLFLSCMGKGSEHILRTGDLTDEPQGTQGLLQSGPAEPLNIDMKRKHWMNCHEAGYHGQNNELATVPPSRRSAA